MKTVKFTEKITLKIGKDDILNGKYVPFTVVSAKLGKMEEAQSRVYKSLRNKLYNSRTCKKFNLTTIAGIECFDLDYPMATQDSALVLVFDKE